MAQIQDPVTAVAAKVSASGAINVTAGGDGYPTYIVQIYSPRVTTAIGAGGVLWAIRAPATKTLDIRNGQIRLSLDTVTTGEVGVEMVRFSTSDPAGGTLYVARPKNTAEPAASTTAIRGASATAGLTGMTVEATTNALLHISLPFIAGSADTLDLADWTGLYLAPGEGLAIRTNPTAAPIGLTLSGWMEFSER